MRPHPPGYVAPRVSQDFGLTGTLAHPDWEKARWTSPFQDIEGPSKPKPRHDVRAKMLWSESGLYIGARLAEPHLWATYTKHDSIIYHENDFEWFVDPDGDAHAYYEWEVNALGTTMDLFMDRPYLTGGNYTFDWEPRLTSKVFRKGTLNDPSDQDDHWSVECYIPWSEFDRHPGGGHVPQIGDQWRISFSRVQWDLDIVDGQYKKIPDRPEHNWTWTNQYAVNMHLPWFWGYLQFEKTADIPFRPDPDHDERMKLVQTFEAQLAHRQKTKAFDLRLPLPPGVELKATETTFQARIRNDQGRWLTMDHLAKITLEP